MDQDISLDVKKRESSFDETRLAPMRRGERGNCVLTVRITADGEPYDLAGKTVRFTGATGDHKLVGPSDVETINASGGVVKHSLPSEMTSDQGVAKGYYEIYRGETYLDTTDHFSLKVIACNDVSAEQASEYVPLISKVAIEEEKRAAAELERATAENLRKEAEKKRASSELQRAESEQSRKTEEESRALAETKRKKWLLEAKDESKKAVDAAKTAASKAAEAKEQASLAAVDARKAAEEARGAVSGDMKIYFKRVTDAQGNSWPVLVDMTV